MLIGIIMGLMYIRLNLIKLYIKYILSKYNLEIRSLDIQY